MPTNSDKEILPVLDRRFGTWRVSIAREPMTVRQLARTYDEQAACWGAKIRRLRTGTFYDEIWASVSESLDAASEGRQLNVLDCGIGQGAFSLALAEQFEVKPHISGIDLSENMLNEAAETLGREGLSFTLKRADVRRLPFEDSQFDIVASAHVIEHLPRPEIVVREMWRVLKPGGRLVLSVTQPSIFGALLQLNWRARTYAYGELEQLLITAGFVRPSKITVGTWSLAARMSLVCQAGKL